MTGRADAVVINDAMVLMPWAPGWAETVRGHAKNVAPAWPHRDGQWLAWIDGQRS
jgi:hypothetical protein